MSSTSVLSPMSPLRRCSETGLTVPECSCRVCCRAQLRRFAPQLAQASPRRTTAFAVYGVEEYARTEGITVLELKRRARIAEVRL